MAAVRSITGAEDFEVYLIPFDLDVPLLTPTPEPEA